MSSPWKVLEPVKAESIQEIMSEEFARGLQEKEDKLYAATLITEPSCSMSASRPPDQNDPVAGPSVAPVADIPEDVLKALQEDTSPDLFDNDAMIAQMLQAQFDMEHDDKLRTVENHRYVY